MGAGGNLIDNLNKNVSLKFRGFPNSNGTWNFITQGNLENMREANVAVLKSSIPSGVSEIAPEEERAASHISSAGGGS
jgi:hypothetical protein